MNADTWAFLLGRDDWFHRGSCHHCSICHQDECLVWNPDPAPGVADPDEDPDWYQVHICPTCDRTQ